MTKNNWCLHLEQAEGLTRPTGGGDKALWQAAYNRHIESGCPECKSRQKTKAASNNRKLKDAAYKACGLTKVYGAISGRTYWE